MAECVDSQKTKDILTCSICLERFIKPKSLPCLHTFCEGCILTYSTSILGKLEGKNHIECPVCRATVRLPKKECTAKEFVDQLPANFLIIGLLEKEKVTRPEKICMSCERLDITSNATFICMDCSDTLCDTCLKYHRANKATSNHDTKPISTLTDEVNIPKAFKNICALHSKKLRLFCNDHDIPCCTLCASLCHRKCDNVVTIEEKAKRFCADAGFEKLKVDIVHVSNDFDTLLSYYTECLQSNVKHYEDNQKMIEIACSNMISKVRAMEITKKAELKKIYEERKHILDDRMDTCTNCKNTVLSDKQTIEVSIEKASEVQVMIEAQKIASQIEKYKQLLKTYKFDGSKILICFATGIQNTIDVFMNSLFKLSVSNEVKFLKLLTDERIPVLNSEQQIASSLNQSVGYFWNQQEDTKIKLHRPIFGTSLAAQNVGTERSFSASPSTSPLLDSLLAGTTLPEKTLSYPVSIVTSVTSGSSAPKRTFSFGQQPIKTGTQSPFSFGQVSSTTPGGGQNLFTSSQKASTTSPGADGYIFPSPQKENIFAGKSSSPVKSPSKTYTDEYEPNVDFKPVIDLPDLVETKTGEEEEEAVFCERANLFRFDDGQWKERGTGELKLLRHKQTKRVRLLMRREQVLKVCANHFLTQEMNLSPIQSSKKAWCWNAQDFSEGEITIEKLAVRFKDEDLALKFKTTFEKLQFELDQVQSKPVKKEPAKTVTSDKPSLGSMFKKEEGSWSCPACLVSNKSDVQKCAACQTLKPGLKPEDAIKTESKSSNVFSSTSSGVKFEKTSSEQKSSGFSFQSAAKPTSAADIIFGQTTKGTNSTTPATGSGFKFVGQTVSTVKTTTSVADTGKPPLSGGFKFGHLPESEKKGHTRSSGFTFQSPKPSGFSFGGETKSYTAKPAAKFSFKPSAPIASPSPSLTVTEIKNKPVSFKPSTPLDASPVIPKSEHAKKVEMKGFGNLFKPKEGSWKCNGCLMSNNSDALKCPACQTRKPGVTWEEAKSSNQSEKKEGKKGFGDFFKPKEGVCKCDGCLVSNNGDVLKCLACGTLKPGVTKEDLPKETVKSSAFGSTGGGFNFGGKGGFTFGTAGNSDIKAGSRFTFQTTDTAGFNFTRTKSNAEKNKPDALAKGFNFTLQPSATVTPEKSSSGFNFTLSPSIDAGPKSPPTDAEGMYLNKDGDDDHIHFEPIIELPSVVDVVTGEENEEVLFQHRSKLFRFVDGEWKERGLGDIKISKHKENGKVRLLMRRAQIYKICLNHYLTQELELKPMPKTDGKAWIWFAMDYSDEEPAMQQLAVKFKNQEIATGFKKAFDDAKVRLEFSVNTKESSVRRVDDSDDRIDDIEFVREEQATKEQITMARKFFLPDHFYLYEKKPSCPGCIGCEDEEPGNYC
ncbi:NUP358 [Mytilus edulis]|uniref:Nuclear pore complex protein Nup153 n=1 Tax=Mytilus edulis TaxID=6550 RepID=A0A8S3UF48_MYTED|nr:NUP358 [Mytilus edulis]